MVITHAPLAAQAAGAPERGVNHAYVMQNNFGMGQGKSGRSSEEGGVFSPVLLVPHGQVPPSFTVDPCLQPHQ
jgi:hypothetical protein